MKLPSDLLQVDSGFDGFTTNAVAGNTTVHTLLAAPGANLRIRIWAWRCIPTNSSTARFTFRLTASGSATIRDVLGQGQYIVQEIPGGYALPTNQGIDIRSNSSAASQAFTASAYYTIERVA
jgi:hypothetical protein